MSKIQLSQRMYSIHDIVRLFESGELSVQPKYQRRRTPWPINAKTALIDTILNNFPLPPIYLRDYVGDDGRRKKEVIDGQQRVSIILEFYQNKFPLSKNIYDEILYNNYYRDLPEEEKYMIQDFEVSFISIRGASDGDIISIFSRLNSFSLPLNPQEKRNSIYAGELKTIIYELASEYNTFWVQFKILSENVIARMQDAALVSDIMFAILYGLKSSSSKLIDKMYKDFDQDFPSRSQIYNNFNKTMTIVGGLLESKHICKVFKSKFMFYTLFLVVYSRLFGLNGKESEKTGNINIQETIDSLEYFSIQYIRPDYEPELKRKFKQSTGNVGQKLFRHGVISPLVK